MSEGPVAQSAYRVPRSLADENYVMSEPLPSISIGSAQVVSVEGETVTVQIGDETISGVVFLGDPPDVGDYVEIESRDDLLVVPDDPSNVPDTFIEGISTTSAHIVSEDDPGTMPDVDVPVAGSMRDLDSWVFLTPDAPAWVAALDQTGAGTEVTHDGSVGGAPGTLWSMLPFDVLPGDVLHLTITGSWLNLSTVSITPVVAYSPDNTADDPMPGDGTQVLPEATSWLLNLPDEVYTDDIVVPDGITTVVDGDVVPARARLGLTIAVTAPATAADADFLLAELTLVRSSMDWPIGSVWFDPDANTGGLTTLGGSDQDTSASTTTLPATASFSRAPGFDKVIVTCPSDTGGMLAVTVLGTFHVSGSPQVEFRLNSDLPGDEVFPLIRLPLTQSFVLMGNIAVDPGDHGEVWVEYRYTSGSGATVESCVTLTTFTPAAARPDEESDPMTRYWDGDSWRPPVLTAISMDYDDGTIVPTGKTATTTTTTRTPSTCDPGDTVTLTATVTPGGANGSVAFYVGPSATGPWTGIGSAPMNASNVATKTYKPTKGATLYFLGKYLGDGGHLTSQDATSATTVRKPLKTVTDTFNATYVQAYNAAGAQIAGAPNPNGVHQGYVNSTTGHRKSLIGFAASGLLPTDADIKRVDLVCHNWVSWAQASNTGSIRLGWHSRATKPTTYGIGTGDTAKSTHSVDQGGWRVTITSWADTAVVRSDFQGIAVGPGASDGNLYQGYSAEGPGVWDLVVTYATRSY